MNVASSPIIIERTCPASVDAVWAALTDPAQMSKWFFEPIAAFEPREGFETEFVVDADGSDYVHQWRVTDVVLGRSISYEWRYANIQGQSQVTWELTSTTELGTTVRLTHAGHESFPRDNPVFSRAAGVGGWTHFLERLAAHVGGEDGSGSHVHHAIDYVEIDVIDLDAAKSFYTKAFGWSFNAYGPTYAGIRKGNGEAGGLRVADHVKPGGPLIIVYSTALETTLEAVRGAGGTITKEVFTFPGGRRFEFSDPDGNVLAVWSDG